jgi:hypothetical protein
VKPSDYLKKGWCQGAFAKDADGNNAYKYGTQPVSWCLWGATCAASMDEEHRKAFGEICLELIGTRDGASWNDELGRTQAEVVALAEEAERRTGL